LAPTEREKNNPVHYYGVDEEKIGVVPCGVILDLFQPEQKQVARKALRQKAKDLEIEDRLTFAGRIEQRYLPPYYSAPDVLVMASHYESFGLVGLEALACSRPVISTPVGAMESFIERSQAGYVVNDSLPLSLAEGI
jgi:D-inositol-3-phosphate glycosyltransferase